MLAGLVRDLNERTRFSCLPVMAKDNAAGAAMALTWLTGFPSNIGLLARRGRARPLALRRGAPCAERGSRSRLVGLGLSSPVCRNGPRRCPLIALTPRAAATERPRALIEIEVGTPGVDHDTIDLSPATGSLAFRAATARKETPSVADVLGKICASLTEEGRALR